MASRFPTEDELSYLVHPRPDNKGFAEGYSLRRSRYEHLANEGSFNCRRDWAKYIGPIGRWGDCNPYEGHFGAVVVPLCRPERISIVSYIFEYAFLYDNVLESAAKASLDEHSDDLVLNEPEYRTVRSTTGTKQIQAKMILELLDIDTPTAEVVIDEWKRMVTTTAKQDKTRRFDKLDDYVEYRMVDTGAPFVDTLMRFGMGIILTPEEAKHTYPVVRPCYAALGLTNDYFSFDVEYDEFCKTDATAMTNCVWLFMEWERLPINQAKQRVQQLVARFETEFLDAIDDFCRNSPHATDNARLYLKAYAYQIPGNAVWSLRCPRYHPEFQEDASRIFGMVDNVAPALQTDHDHSAERPSDDRAGLNRDEGDVSDSSGSSRSESAHERIFSKRPSVATRASSVGGSSEEEVDASPVNEPLLGKELLYEPYKYISSLPSKGIRDAFIDALNVWLGSPESVTNGVKSVIGTLHNASLILDDIQDGSPLRRGKPATHTIFGQGQSINSGTFLIIQALNDARRLDGLHSVDIFVEEMEKMFVGQSFDLHWSRHNKCPTEAEYLEMIDCKTGGLFRLAVRLLLDSRHHRQQQLPLDHLVKLLGRFFQIRDDYKNLSADEYTDQKGFCEDLDEGKYSFPLIHALNSEPSNLQLREILRECKSQGGLSNPLKLCVLEQLHAAGSMEYTEKRMGSLMQQIYEEIGQVEKVTDCMNWALRLLVRKLQA